MWGPDGWLYGTHGVFTHSLVGKPGTPDEERIPLNAGVWRYHPQRHEFEVFAHGTSNPWGLDFDEYGNCWIEACVIPHLFQIVQGGRFQRQAGQHFNPYTYDDIKQVGDHVHYLGANPHGGNGRSDAAGGGHAHSGMMVYQGDAWPEEYRGSPLHEQHPRRPDQPRHPRALRLRLRRPPRPRLPPGQRPRQPDPRLPRRPRRQRLDDRLVRPPAMPRPRRERPRQEQGAGLQGQLRRGEADNG